LPKQNCIREIVEYVAALVVVKSLELAPRSCAERLACVYTRLLELAVPRLRRVALKNLSMSLPELDAAEQHKIADGVFRSIERLLVSFAKFPQIMRGALSEWVRCEGYEYYEAALRRGRGVLFATAHLGNWELSAFAHALFASPMHVVVRPLDNLRIDALVARRRTLSGNHLIEKKNSAREILRALAANQAVGILIDQNAAIEEGIFVDFFGVPACAGTGFAKLATHSGATVIPGFAFWLAEESRYVLRLYPPIEMSGDAAQDTGRLHQFLESLIRQYPDQWLWIHRRWKTRPSGEAPIY